MPSLGGMYGPDFTYLGVAKADLGDETTYADADVVIMGAPFDGGTSYRSGCRMGPQAIRAADYLPHDGSRPHLALRGFSPKPRPSRSTTATECSCPWTSTSSTQAWRPAPEPGGLTGRQLLDAVRRLCLELPVVGLDVVEVAPAYDNPEVTAALGNRVVLEALSAIAAKRGGEPIDPSRPLLEGR